MRRLRVFPAICVLLASAPAVAAPDGDAPTQAQAAQALVNACAKVACRKVTRTLVLRTPDGGRGEIDTDLYPYLDPDGTVILYPDETITLALPKDGNGEPRLVKVVEPSGTTNFSPLAPSEGSLEFSFNQMDGKPDMTLKATSTVDARLKYDAVIFAATNDGVRPSPTSICPLLPPQMGAPTFSSFESWPYPIVDLVIHNFRVLPPDAAGAYKTPTCN